MIKQKKFPKKACLFAHNRIIVLLDIGKDIVLWSPSSKILGGSGPPVPQESTPMLIRNFFYCRSGYDVEISTPLKTSFDILMLAVHLTITFINFTP